MARRNKLTPPPDDVQAVALPLLEVRLGLDEAATADVVEDILGSVDVPVYPNR